jgi:hypothetical protein
MPNLKDRKSLGNVPQFIKENPIGSSIISKLNRDVTKVNTNPLDANLPNIGLGTYQKIRNNDDIIKISPDIELAIQIITSSIISPNNSLQSNLSYTAPNIKIPGAIKQTLLDRIKQQMNLEYNLETKLTNILRETLFTKGAYIEAIIPEASLDDIISQYGFKGNYSSESFYKAIQHSNYGFLGDTSNDKIIINKVSSEDKSSNSAFKITTQGLASDLINGNNSKTEIITLSPEELGIEVTDNFNILNLQNLLVKNAHYTSRKKVYRNGLSTEEKKEKEVNLDLFFRLNSTYQQQDIVKVSTRDDASRKSLGKPLVIKLPTESVIPVHVLNDPSKHLGYFVLLDQNGTPIQGGSVLTDDEAKYYSVSNIETDSKLNTIKKAATGLYGMLSPDIKLDNLEDIYTKIVEDLIKKKLKTGAFGDLADIKDSADIFRTMFVRALRSQQTKILFIPSELVAYYAFEYRENGTGKSWMEKASIFYSIKAILMFARIMAYLKNSTTTTEVNVTLDEFDTNPTLTMEHTMSEILKTRQNMLPLGVIRPDDLVNWIQKAGIKFKWSGNTGLPNMDISTTETNTNYIVPDDELDQTITKNIYMTFGLTPEIVEAGYSTDFATTVIAKNILFAKRISKLQDTFNKLLTDHVRKLIVNDLMLIDDMKDIISIGMTDIKKTLSKNNNEEDKDFKKLKPNDICNYIIDSFLNELEVYLPSPETPQNETIKAQYDTYKGMLDDVLDAVVSTEFINEEYFGQISGKVDGIRTMLKGACLMKWMQDNNFMPELSELVTKDDEGNYIFNAFDNMELFGDSIVDAFITYMKHRSKAKTKSDKKLEKLEQAGMDSGSSDYSSTTDENTEGGADDNEETSEDISGENTSDTGSNDTGSGEFNMDDMGMSMGGDFGGKGNTSGDQTNPETEKLEQDLLKAKLEKEKAYADRAKAEAIEKKRKYNITDDELKTVDDEGNDLDVESTDENQEGEPTEGQERPEQSAAENFNLRKHKKKIFNN